ncbi:tRNA guanosine(34) transglycosylase Tgt [bacterium]|nr:tRNA guanosine(34) transglycosylase Tgt [bacterium]
MSFEVLKTSGRARLGRLRIGGLEIETPAFMPVGTLGTVRTLEPGEVQELGYSLILGNTYHLSLRPGVEVIGQFGGLKNFMRWPGALLTDSGGFQVFSLSKIRELDDDGVTFSSPSDGGKVHRLTPERALEIQRILGSDIAMVLDECPPHPCERAVLEAAVRRTIDWAARSKRWAEEHGMPGQVFAITQGGLDVDLRRRCLEEIAAVDFPGYAIGGLSVGEPNELMYETLDRILPEYPPDRPRYLMGVGAPRDLETCVALGVDLFDCVLPTRNARRGQLLTAAGPLNIRNSVHEKSEEPPDETCGCRVCRTYSRAYLRHLFMSDEILGLKLATYHNLAHISALMANLRQTIRQTDSARN